LLGESDDGGEPVERKKQLRSFSKRYTTTTPEFRLVVQHGLKSVVRSSRPRQKSESREKFDFGRGLQGNEKDLKGSS